MIVDRSSSSRYRRLIDSGIYDDYFPLRANACYHILDKTSNGSFTLRDFVDNVKFISSYLGIYMDTSSDFTIIGEFRYLDRRGNGHVNIDCFIAGLICKISQLSNNDSILKSMTEELIPGIDCKADDLIRFLQSPSLSKLNDTSFYRKHFYAFTNLLLDYLYENIVDGLIGHDTMKVILRKTIKRVIAELQNHFHLSSDGLERLLAETTEPLSSTEFQENYLGLQTNSIKWNVNDLRVSNYSCDSSYIEEKDDENDYGRNDLFDRTASIMNNDNIKTESSLNMTNSLDQTGMLDYSPLDEIDMSGFDKTQLFLLNTAFKSLKSFFNLTIVKNEESNLSSEQVTKIENIAKELKKFNFHYDRGTSSNEDDEQLTGSAALMADLAATKEELKRISMRAEVLEIGQLAVKSGTVDIDLQNSDHFLQKNGETTIMFSDMLNEIEQLRVCVAERGNRGMVLGSFLQTDFACIENKSMKKTLKGMHDQIGLLQKRLIEQSNEHHLHDENVKLSTMQEADIAELNAMKEQLQNERGEYLTRSVELQVLREEVHRLKVSNEELKKFELVCIDLTMTIKKLEEEKINMLMSSSTTSSSSHAETTLNVKLEEGVAKYNNLKTKYDSISLEHRRLEKENNRLSGLLKAADERTKLLLQDHMVIKNQLNESQDVLAANKAFSTKLLHDLDREGLLQLQNEQLAQKVLELQIELQKLKSKTVDYNSETNNSKNYIEELSAAEKKIDELENKVGELSIAVEKGHVASEQLEIFREQLRAKSKESSEYSLLLQSMDLKVKDKELVKVANKELSHELAEYKVKIEKVPGLLAEIARLRGSSRASVKALSEQDKHLSECKQRIKELERSNSKLHNDIRLYKDSDSKLKEVTKELELLQKLHITENSNIEI